MAFRPVEELKPDPNNARTHSGEQVEQVAASIRRFGWTMPALVDDVIRAGNCRQEAARLIYAAGERIWLAPGRDRGGEQIPDGTMPVLDCSGWTDEERRAYALADNQLALNAGWDEDVLSAELLALSTLGFDIPVIGFDEAALHRLLHKSDGETDPDTVPDLPENPVSQPGDVWLMGDHRLICGSSTDPDTVAELLGDDRPHLMVTDPPYGVEYDASWREKAKNADGSRLSVGKHAKGMVKNDDQADWSAAWALFKGDAAYVWHADNKAHVVAESLIAQGFEPRAQIIWNKPVHVIGRGDYHPKHEPCWYVVRKGRPGHYGGGRKQNTVWEIQNMHRTQGSVDDGQTGHSTQKPVECMQRPVENNSKHGDWVYEPFSGSFTTGIACEITGRRCLAVELNPPYVDMGVTRWEAFTGKQATLKATGQTFAQVRDERLGASTLPANRVMAASAAQP